MRRKTLITDKEIVKRVRAMGLFTLLDVGILKETDLKEWSKDREQNTKQFSQKWCKAICEGLIDGGFIPQRTNLRTFYIAINTKHTQRVEPSLKWLKSRALLAYFIDSIFYDNTDGIKQTNWNFGRAFGVSGLKQAKVKYLVNNKDVTGKPLGYEQIDRIIAIANKRTGE